MSASGSILITGANGFLGRALVNYLVAKSRPPLLGVRRPETLSDQPSRTVALGSLEQKPALAGKLKGVETIVHCAGLAHVLGKDAASSVARFHAINCEGTLHLAREAQMAGVKRFIFISTIGVNGEQTFNQKFTPDDVPAPMSPYASSKLRAEIALRQFAKETGLEIVIIRPPLIIGPHSTGNVGTIAKMILMGVPLPFSCATRNRRTVASIETMCSLMEACIEHPAATNRTFLAGDDRERSTRQIIEMVGKYVGRKPVLLPVPITLLRMSLLSVGKSKLEAQLFGDLEVDISNAVRILGWQPFASE